MDTYLNNSTAYETSRSRGASSARVVNDRSAADRLRSGSGTRGSGMRGEPRAPRGGATSAGARSGRRAGTRGNRRSNFMRYASDNRVVQTIYAITTGPWRFAFYGAVIVAALLSVYFPARDLYAAYRTGDILERQLEVRQKYNEGLEAKVDKLLSTEGIEDAARKNLGLVMPGEHAVEVIGLDDGGSSANESESSDSSSEESSDADNASDSGADDAKDGAESTSSKAGDETTDDQEQDDSAHDAATQSSQDGASSDAADDGEDEPQTSADVEEAEQAIVNDAPWYIKILDAVFFYQGIEGQTVSSTGAQ